MITIFTVITILEKINVNNNSKAKTKYKPNTIHSIPLFEINHLSYSEIILVNG